MNLNLTAFALSGGKSAPIRARRRIDHLEHGPLHWWEVGNRQSLHRSKSCYSLCRATLVKAAGGSMDSRERDRTEHERSAPAPWNSIRSPGILNIVLPPFAVRQAEYAISGCGSCGISFVRRQL